MTGFVKANVLVIRSIRCLHVKCLSTTSVVSCVVDITANCLYIIYNVVFCTFFFLRHIFMPPEGGHIVFGLSVCLFVCLFVTKL